MLVIVTQLNCVARASEIKDNELVFSSLFTSTSLPVFMNAGKIGVEGKKGPQCIHFVATGQ